MRTKWVLQVKCLEECSVHSENYVSTCYVLSCSFIVLLYITQDRSSTQTHISMEKEFYGPLTGRFSDLTLASTWSWPRWYPLAMFVSLCCFDFRADALFMALPPVLGLYPSTQQLGSTSFLLAPVKWACPDQPNSDYMSTSEQGGSSLARPWDGV